MMLPEINIQRIENSFVDDYEFWKNFLVEINETLKKLRVPESDLLDYDEFCVMFKNNLIFIDEMETNMPIILKIESALQQVVRDKLNQSRNLS